MSSRGRTKGRGDLLSLRLLLSLWLLLGLGAFGLQAAVHSVHHLFDPDAAAHCDVVAASTHVIAAGGGSPAATCPPVSVAEARAAADAARVEVRTLRAEQGRAPPAARS